MNTNLTLIELVYWICSAIALGAALTATFMSSIRFAILSLWVCGLAVGGIFLSQGAELLAITQWIVSTLGALCFIFYSVMLGEYHSEGTTPFKRKLVSGILPTLAGLGFSGVIWLGSHSLSSANAGANALALNMAPPTPENAHNLTTIGKSLIDKQFLSLQILGLTLFLVVVGAGVIARPEMKEKSS